MIPGRKGILIALAVMLLFTFGLVDCSKKAPAEQSAGESMTQTPPSEAPPSRTEEYKPPAEETAMMPSQPRDTGMDTMVEEMESFDPDDLIDVFFAYDRSDLTADSRDRLSRNAKLLKAAANVNIVIEGHCDERGTNEYNLGLGERRANAVKNYLMSLGVSGSRIKTISYGEEKPFAMGHSEISWRQNRRAHFDLQ